MKPCLLIVQLQSFILPAVELYVYIFAGNYFVVAVLKYKSMEVTLLFTRFIIIGQYIVALPSIKCLYLNRLTLAKALIRKRNDFNP